MGSPGGQFRGSLRPLLSPVRQGLVAAISTAIPMDSPMIECFFDCSSPWTWLAFRKLRPLAAELGETVRWKPVLVGGIFNAVNPSVYEFREKGVPAKLAYHRKDLQDWAQHQGVKILFPPSVFPVNSVKAMRACCWLIGQGPVQSVMEPFAEAVFKAYWSDDRDIAQEAVLAQIATAQGQDAAALLAAINTPEVKAQLKANTDEAIQRGAFGSPTFFVGGDDMYFGNDRLVLVREAVLRRRSAP
jgi:2-hydroxychromene-2-carboxylate isomerase